MSDRYRVQGMDCADCARTIEKGVASLSGVRSAQVDFATSTLILEGDVSDAALRQRVQVLGYKLADEAAIPRPPASSLIAGFFQHMLGSAASRFALAGAALFSAGALAWLVGLTAVSAGLFTAATLIALLPIARSGLANLVINRSFNINFLMTVAAVGALILGEPAEGAAVVVLFAIGEALEGFTTDRARQSIRGLMDVAPNEAVRLIPGGSTETVPVAALRAEDRVLVRPGERIPADGVVEAGVSAVDQAAITGESIPVAKAEGDEVFAGTVNGGGALEIRVTRLAADSTVQRIITLVEQAESARAPSQRAIDEFARWYTPAVTVGALAVALVAPLLFGAPFWNTPSEEGWLYRALAMLVIACPCALVISTPVTVVSAISRAARSGVLIKGGAYLELLGKLRALAFDKTGTLTQGKPVVTLTQSVECDGDPNCDPCIDLLALAAAVEGRSAHPLARAVVTEAEAHGVANRYAAAGDVMTLGGRGVTGTVGDRRVTVGSHALFDAEHPHSAALCDAVSDAEAAGQSTLMLDDDGQVRGFLAAADTLRPESAAVIAELNALGLHTIMLTGDHDAAAQAIGRAAGIRDVRAGLLPADKLTAIGDLMMRFGTVGMVGDGINDTPALAAASVGVAMGAGGSAQALETADVALMADSLSRLPFAVRLSRRARRLIRQNIALSLGVKMVFLTLAVLGLTSLWGAVLADVGMLLLVTVNGLRAGREMR
ncbi:MAG TPA: cation-translocating P-type ATPase [Candidatus Limnocylindrales bacterium]|nr:cation-translocating P-type ATPase [Candidatus Limnocylindrales bacterium]